MTATPTHHAPLADLTVVEHAGSIAGAYASRLFAVGGARVVVVGEDSLTADQCSYLRAGTELTPTADGIRPDVVIQSSQPAPLHPRAVPDGVVSVEISPTPSTGARAGWQATDLVDYAMSGHAYLYGHPDREPLRGPPDQPAIAAGMMGFIGAMAALFERARSDHAPRVQVNHHDTMLALHQMTFLRWMLTGDLLTRMGNRYTGQGQPNGPYRCSDGWIAITCVTDPQVEGLLAVTGLLGLLDDPAIDSPMDFQAHPEVLDEPLRAWLAKQSVDETVELFQAMRIPACPLRSPIELLDDPQAVGRKVFQPLADGRLAPRPPSQRSHEQPSGGHAWQPTDEAADAGPLQGLRVLDMTRVWAGPLCTRILADLGAEVIGIEGPGGRGPQVLPDSFVRAAGYFPRIDPLDQPWNRNGHMTKYGLGKQSLCIDLQTDAGREIYEQLVPTAHVLVENFTPRVMPQLGLDEDRLHELNPDLVYVTMPGYGRSGPAEHWLAYGSCIDSHAGLSALTGYADEHPWKGGIAWPDPVAGLHACAALLSTLWAMRAGDLGGCTIESPQFEATLAAIGDRIVEAQGDGYAPTGNADPTMAAQGVYQCIGDDRWIAVSIIDENHVDAIRAVAATHGLDPDQPIHDLATELARQSYADDLARALQSAAIPAGPVESAREIFAASFDSDAFIEIDQPDMGPFRTTRTPIVFDGAPLGVGGPAPRLGEHNETVLLDAGLTPSMIATAIENGVIADRPPR